MENKPQPQSIKTTLAATRELATVRAEQDMAVTRQNGYVLIMRPGAGFLHHATNNPAGLKLADIPGFTLQPGDHIIARKLYQRGEWQDVGDSIDSGLRERSAGNEGQQKQA